MNRTLRIVVLLLTVALVFAVASCGKSATTTTAAATTTTTAATTTTAGSTASTTATTAGAGADTITLAVSADPSSLDQDFVAFDTIALAIHKNIYPFLIDYGVTQVSGADVQDTTKILPLYAESFKSDDGGKTWILKIKKGIKFPSGNELTADDVKWSKDRAFAAQANVAGVYRIIGLNKPEQVEKVDQYTVKFTQDAPSALTELIQVIGLYVFDSVEMKKHATADDPWAKTWATQNSTGGGAFNVKSWQKGAEIVLEANPVYPLGEPAVKTVRIVIIPAAANRRLQLEKGDVDIALDLPRKDLTELKSNPDLKVVSVPSNEFVFIPLDVTKPPFDNKIVRQAMAYAIPYAQIISGVYGGDARAATSPVPLDMPGSSPKGYPYTYDLEKAKALMQQAGMEKGFQTTLAIDQSNEEQEQIAILVQSELKKINVTVNIEKLDPATFVDRRAKKTVPMQVASGQLWVNDVQYMLGTSMTEGGFLNYANYNNPSVNDIYKKLGETTDNAARMALVADLQTILADDVPWLMLAQPNFNVPMRKNISGWVQPVDALFRLQYLKKG
jgi:peptide/nickel transport system substrate-binding protein